MPTVDLWPDELVGSGELSSPTKILKEQAALLGQKTRNIVEAEVQSTTTIDDKEFIDIFQIVGPTIKYRYQLFHLNYPLEFYPARLYWENGDRNTYEVRDEEELIEVLRIVLSDEKTKKVVQAILARSKYQ